MELIKTRLQIQNDYPTAIKHKSPLDCLRHIYKTEGTRGVFKGFGITITRDVPGKTFFFVITVSLLLSFLIINYYL